MCVVSWVDDHYSPIIPTVEPIGWPDNLLTLPIEGLTLDELKEAVASYKRARAAAEVIDKETNQADCEDPIKKQLLDRIAELEKIIANPPEFVIIKGGNVEPGTYRVLDGKLYKVVE